MKSEKFFIPVRYSLNGKGAQRFIVADTDSNNF